MIYKKILRKGYSVPRDFMNWKWQTETPTLRNLERNKRLLYRLPNKLNTFRRNKTVHHADIITYFNCLFLKADKQTIRRGKIIHIHNVQKSEKSFGIYLYYLKNELVKASSLKPSLSRLSLEPNPFWMRRWHTKGKKNEVFSKINIKSFKL